MTLDYFYSIGRLRRFPVLLYLVVGGFTANLETTCKIICLLALSTVAFGQGHFFGQNGLVVRETKGGYSPPTAVTEGISKVKMVEDNPIKRKNISPRIQHLLQKSNKDPSDSDSIV